MLSDILIRDFIAEMANRPKFTALTDTQKLQRLNGLCRRISGWFNSAGRTDYDVSTVAGGVLSGALGDLGVRSEAFTCDIVGTRIPFSSPLVGEYTLAIYELDGVAIDAPILEQDETGFTAYGTADGVRGIYHAILKQ